MVLTSPSPLASAAAGASSTTWAHTVSVAFCRLRCWAMAVANAFCRVCALLVAAPLSWPLLKATHDSRSVASSSQRHVSLVRVPIMAHAIRPSPASPWICALVPVRTARCGGRNWPPVRGAVRCQQAQQPPPVNFAS